MMKHDTAATPGLLRTGAVQVASSVDSEIAYEGPDADMVAELVSSIVDELNAGETRRESP